MAACLITVSGTSGLIRIDYTISGTPYNIQTSIGSFYIDDTATDVTYTTLSGDLIAVDSGCLTPSIAELPAICYSLKWSGIYTTGYIANAIFLGYGMDGEITITNTSFPNSKNNLAESINNAGDNRVKVIGYYITTIGEDMSSTYILKVIGNERPDLRVRNADNTEFLYIHGELTSCTLPAEYELVAPCYTSDPVTTTTLAP